MMDGIINLTDLQKEQFQKYMELVLKYNEVMNLTAITDPQEFYEKHFYDSLLPCEEIDFNNKEIIDIGSGAGFPGIPLAIAFPTSKFTLLDPLAKRCNFLEIVIKELNLKNVKVVNKRAEDITNLERENYDIAVSRAVASLNILLELSIPYVKVNGEFIAYKGLKYQEEIDNAKEAFNQLNIHVKKIQKAKLHFSKEERFNIIILKDEVTNKRFPRNFSQIKKKPL